MHQNPQPNTKPLGRRDRTAERMLAALVSHGDSERHEPSFLVTKAYALADALARERHNRWLRQPQQQSEEAPQFPIVVTPPAPQPPKS